MRRLALLAVAAVSLLVPVGLSPSANAAAQTNAVDLSFMQKNAQTNLAEITIGKIALGRSQSAATTELAQKTMSDHEAALAKLKTVAANLNVTLPTEPNAAQQGDAAKLKAVATSEFDATYAMIQVLGHQLSIANTNTELSAGSDSAVQSFATGYLPVAQMHLMMAENLLTSLGGTIPSAVPAGSGGAGATTSALAHTAALGIGVLGFLLIAFAATTVARRRRIS